MEVESTRKTSAEMDRQYQARYEGAWDDDEEDDITCTCTYQN